MDLFEKIGLDAGYVIIGTVTISIVLFILVLVLFSKCNSLSKKYKQFMDSLGDTDQKMGIV